MMYEPQTRTLEALGQMEGLRSDLHTLQVSLEAAPLWQPAKVLHKQCQEAMRMLDDVQGRMDQKLVVTLIGPSGSGKSTLMNALAGVDALTPTGIDRPTTREVTVLSQRNQDAQWLLDKLGPEQLRLITSSAANHLNHLLLVDTPDTDSTEQARHIAMVKKAIALSDILLCVFHAENPKRRDHIDFMAPFVRLFSGTALICIVNHCDRQEEKELRNRILPDFRQHLHSAWDTPVASILCLSARRHLQNPAWDQGATPKHSFDQFDELRQMITTTLRKATLRLEQRLDNAHRIREYMLNLVAEEVAHDWPHLNQAIEQIQSARPAALQAALNALEYERTGQALGVASLLYQHLAQRWIGPIGWLIGTWSRMLSLGYSLLSLFRPAKSWDRIKRLATAMTSSHNPDPPSAAAEQWPPAQHALQAYRLAMLHRWPDIADALTKARFRETVRSMDQILPQEAMFRGELTTVWLQALTQTIETAAKRLSSIPLQLLFNLPVVLLLGHVGWTTVNNYVRGQYLSGNFFLHAFLALAAVLFVSFFVFQGGVRLLAGSERILRRAILAATHSVSQTHQLLTTPVISQLETLSVLAQASNPATDAADRRTAYPGD